MRISTLPGLTWLRRQRVYRKRKRFERSVQRWAPVLAEIFDQIRTRRPVGEILASTRGPLPVEVRCLLERLRAVGYLEEAPLPSDFRISVIIPHYHQTPWLEDTLASLAEQTVAPHEVLVVDDGTEDFLAVQKVCERYAAVLPLRLHRAPRRLFAGGARQWGAEQATGELLVMHDADDLSHPYRLELTRDVFRREPRALQLNVGVFPFRGRPPNLFRAFTGADLDARLHPPEELLRATRTLFIEQRFSRRTGGGVVFRPGFYGLPPDSEQALFACSPGHVAYPRSVAARLPWLSAPELAARGFTDFEDLEFNVLLLLAGQAGFQLDLPLIEQRLGTSTNWAYCREVRSRPPAADA